MNKLYSISVNRKTDGYGTPSSIIVVAAASETEARAMASSQVTDGRWISGVKEAAFIFVTDERNVGMADEQGQEISY